MQRKFDPATKYPRHPRAHEKGGVHLKDHAAKIKEVGLNLLKNMGVKIKEEGVFDLLKISRPAIVSAPKTFLECVSPDFYYNDFLNKAAACNDPLERLQWVVAFFVSGIHRNPVEMQNCPPLNPILGETYVSEKADGTKLYCEQISHHPPVSAYLCVGPNNSYKLYGTGEVTIHMNGFNNIIGKRLGKTTIEFPDGAKIVYTNPDTRIDGLLMGDRRHNYVNTCVFLDKRNKISAEVNFLYEAHGAVAKLTSGIKKLFGHSKEAKHAPDAVDVIFFNYDKNQDGDAQKKVLCEGTGSWLSYLQIDGKLFWRIDEETGDFWMDKQEQKLPSDSTFRDDSKNIKIKDFDKAQKAKDYLENVQRHDAKMRKEYSDRYAKSGRIQAGLEVQ